MDAVEDIKQRLSIEDVVGQYVQLKRAGRNWKGLSPFTNERTPSFVVSPEKQIWHDFSSGRGGDMFSFVMEVEGLDFRGTLELLARQAGIDLDQYRSKKGDTSTRSKEKERLYDVLELATKFYQVQFSKHRLALEYVLKKRQFSKETALAWRIGYSPEDGDTLVRYARQKGFSEYELKAAGLTAQRYRGLGDMFRGRIMVPLADQQGRIIGFTARLLKDDPNAPKYINTPGTQLYDKSRHVFGLHLAKDAIRKNKYAVIAEGNLDVIASHQADVAQVVATAGTALTEYQLKTLGRLTPDIRLCFDADRAGVEATERAIPIASKVGVSLSVITIPAGKDPDELVRQDPAIWQQIITKPTYAIDWLIERYAGMLDLASAQGKKQFSDIIIKTITTLNDPVEKEHYLNEVSKRISVDRKVLDQKVTFNEAPPRLKKPKFEPRQSDKESNMRRIVQNHLLSMLITHVSLRDELMGILSKDMFTTKESQSLFELLAKYPKIEFRPEVMDRLEYLTDYVKMLLVIYEEERYQELDEVEFRSTLNKLLSRLIVSYVKSQNILINEAYKSLDTDKDQTKRKELSEKSRYLQSLMERYKSN